MSDVGIQQAKNIPVGDIITRQYCRTWQTTVALFYNSTSQYFTAIVVRT
ncbi:MAG: hypothetical protein WBA77_13480 [Microcoleaceae cyanobacterium]